MIRIEKTLTLNNLVYPNDFYKFNGVHIDDSETQKYLVEIIGHLKQIKTEGDKTGFCKISTGDMTILGYIRDMGYEIEVYRNPHTCTVYFEDEEKGE